ncbi:MAG TPA: hypothetical protein VEY09_17725 [Pyrinomonadaceae bacterium]|nr:hypothetical protein [Pyrinomonadaceae bacterium]
MTDKKRAGRESEDEQAKAGARRESRRRFTKQAVGAALATPAALAAARGQTRPAPPEAPAPPKPQPTPAQQQSQPPSPAAAAYLEVARALYGQHLTPEEFERLRRDLENNVRTSERLAAAKLANADEPDFVFSA